MRIVLLLLLAMLAIKTTSAQGQEACSRSYGSCLDRCVAKPSKMLQESCTSACQSQNNVCFSKHLGVPGSAVQTVRQEPVANTNTNAAPPAATEQRPAAQPVTSAGPVKPASPVKTAKPAMHPAERRAP